MKLPGRILACAASVTLLAGLGTSANAETLGWSESGSISSSTSAMSTFSTAKHTGKAEKKEISGTTHKRAHGWTTWSGVYHYTRARLEKGSTINGDSGRVWRSNGSEAISPWKPYTVSGGNLVDPGTARTYYGR